MPPTSWVAADARAPEGCTGGWMVSPERTETAVAGVRKADEAGVGDQLEP